MVNDSWEAGAQNWTDDLPQQFRARRGYDLQRWMPVLTGRVVDSAAASDAFLWDFRRTLGELLADNHYAQIGDALRARGMIHYVESHESRRAFIGDGMDAKRNATVPMSATWVGGLNPPESLRCGCARVGIGRTSLRTEPGRGGIPDRPAARLLRMPRRISRQLPIACCRTD